MKKKSKPIRQQGGKPYDGKQQEARFNQFFSPALQQKYKAVQDLYGKQYPGDSRTAKQLRSVYDAHGLVLDEDFQNGEMARSFPEFDTDYQKYQQQLLQADLGELVEMIHGLSGVKNPLQLLKVKTPANLSKWDMVKLGMKIKGDRKNYTFQQGGAGSAIIEQGEIARDQQGNLLQVSPQAPSHDDPHLVTPAGVRKVKPGKGGIVAQNLESVLSDSQSQINRGERTNNVKDALIKIKPAEASRIAQELGLKLKPGQSLSPTKFFTALQEARDKQAAKYTLKDKFADQTGKPFQAAQQVNSILQRNLPDDQELYDHVFSVQEDKKTVLPDFENTPNQTMQQGGAVPKAKLSIQGYKRDSPDRFEPSLTIPGNSITMQGVDHPVMLYGDGGEQILAQPGKDYVLPDSQSVLEIPMAQYGLNPRQYAKYQKYYSRWTENDNALDNFTDEEIEDFGLLSTRYRNHPDVVSQVDRVQGELMGKPRLSPLHGNELRRIATASPDPMIASLPPFQNSPRLASRPSAGTPPLNLSSPGDQPDSAYLDSQPRRIPAGPQVSGPQSSSFSRSTRPGPMSSAGSPVSPPGRYMLDSMGSGNPLSLTNPAEPVRPSDLARYQHPDGGIPRLMSPYGLPGELPRAGGPRAGEGSDPGSDTYTDLTVYPRTSRRAKAPAGSVRIGESPAQKPFNLDDWISPQGDPNLPTAGPVPTTPAPIPVSRLEAAVSGLPLSGPDAQAPPVLPGPPSATGGSTAKTPAKNPFRPDGFQFLPDALLALDAMKREPILRQQLEEHELKLDRLNPTAARQDLTNTYKTATSGISDPHTQMGRAQGVAQYAGYLNALNSLNGQYDSQNTEVSNQEAQYNNQMRRQVEGTNLQLNDQFYTRDLQTREAQREQLFTALNSASTKLATAKQQERNYNLFKSTYAPKFQMGDDGTVSFDDSGAPVVFRNGSWQPAAGSSPLSGTRKTKTVTDKEGKLKQTEVTQEELTLLNRLRGSKGKSALNFQQGGSKYTLTKR